MTRRWYSLGDPPSAKLQQLCVHDGGNLRARAVAGHETGRHEMARSRTADRNWEDARALRLRGPHHRKEPLLYSTPLGILVVTRTIAQADEIVATVKELLSALPPPGTECEPRIQRPSSICLAMRAADVLVITHEAYTKPWRASAKTDTGDGRTARRLNTVRAV